MSEHPGPLLSALADGDLQPAERAAVEEHVAGCEGCRRELRAITRLRDAVTSLPSVEPPTWFLPGVLADGPQPRVLRARRFRFGVANVAATAAAWLVLVGVTTPGPVPAASPDLAGLVAAHTQASSGAAASMDVSADSALPATLGSAWTLAGSRRLGATTQAVYRAGDRWLSLFAQPGGLDPDALPAAARPVAVAGTRAWELDAASGTVLLVDRGDATIVLVGQAGTNGVPLPADLVVDRPGDSVLDRLAEAGAGLLRAFSLGG